MQENPRSVNYVVLVSADVEWQAAVRKFNPLQLYSSPYGEWFDREYLINKKYEIVRFFQGGWGKIRAAGSTQYVIDHYHPRCIINVGTCGGMAGRIEKGTTILVTETIVYDIIELMGDFDAHINNYKTQLDLTFLKEPYPMKVLLTKILSADRDILKEDIPWLVEKFQAVAADWESGAIAFVASRNKIPLIILRGVTDLVGEWGGEAYGDVGLFRQNAQRVMEELLEKLPDWLECLRIEYDRK